MASNEAVMSPKMTFLKKQKHIVSNAGWLFADRVVRMVGGLFVGVWVARYLGPGRYGLLNYSVAFVSLFSAFATLGLDRLVIRDVVRHPENRREIMGTAFVMKLTGGLLAQTCAVTAVQLVRGDWHVTLLVAIVSGSALCQSLDVIDFWFQSKILSKFTVMSRNGAFVCFSLVKIGLIVAKAPLIAFAAATAGESLLAAAVLFTVYHRLGGSAASWKFQWARAREFMRDGWPLLVAYMAYLLYAKIDQVMIGSMLGDKPLGIYSASSKVSEIPVAVLLIVGSSVFPKLVDLYEKDRAKFFEWYSKITGAFTWIAALLFVFLLFTGRFWVHLLFGADFAQSASVLNFQAVGLIFMFNGGLRSAFLTISSNQKILSATTVFSAFFNVALNLLLIPRYGIFGGAMAGVCVQAVSLFLLNLVTPQTRTVFKIQLDGLLLFPLLWRLLAKRHAPSASIP